ncbi:hypothetical protein P0W64_15170 [Tsukamurella sp. 8F]|uniref:hypothetical protein n=1 Tax=unclassified Tsukamurella TaxID=2633480 RepID=UPI0023BA1BAC|nr:MULTISPECIES: hypothetical protein [unclassified Tsukamurella]MDF0529132.1 hypothetical protein [Tsukamurella sp. 8J]MDF0588118.1 hypothetical protein [Tsukamurella sp. 8F]
MYLDRIVASGVLDADRADLLRWETTRYSSRIYVVVGRRRILAQNLPMCWEDLAIGPGTPVGIEVSSGVRNLLDDEQRAVAGFANRFQELLIPVPPRPPMRTHFWRRTRRRVDA